MKFCFAASIEIQHFIEIRYKLRFKMHSNLDFLTG